MPHPCVSNALRLPLDNGRRIDGKVWQFINVSYDMVLRSLCVILGAVMAFGLAFGQHDNRCHIAIARMEEQESLPKNLLQAVALGESGRRNEEGKFRAWPWTIHAQGQGKYFATKQEAVKEVYRLKSEGVRSIDIGCMQVNIMHHPEAFRSIEEAFEPENNVAYAGKFLKNLHKQTGSWTQAVAHYHSADEVHGGPYQHRIYELWNALQRNGMEDVSVMRKAESLAQFRWWKLAKSPFQRLTRAPFAGMKGSSLFQQRDWGKKDPQKGKKSKKSSKPVDLDHPKLEGAHQVSAHKANGSQPESASQANLRFFPLDQNKFRKITNR